MSSTPSFERFNYLLRTNKHIERKLVFDVLYSASQKTSFEDHWYLGFGSMWFGDFRLAHRLLGLKKMVSIELPDHAERANFNRPYSGVVVEPGMSGQVLGRLAADTWRDPVVAWMDYDGRLDDDVVKDIRFILDHACPSSTLVVTINGARNTYRTKNAKAREETSVGVVESYLGSPSIGPKYEPKPNNSGVFVDLSEDAFPEFLCDALLTFMQHRVIVGAREVDGRRLRFVPLFLLHHRDGADMITVGGALVREGESEAWRQCVATHPVLSGADGAPAYRRLDLVPVTIKEKITLDECLPFPDGDAQYIESARTAGLCLADEELRKYRKFYRHFPVFVETPV